MADPFLLIGGAVVIFALLLGGDEKPAPAPKPPVVPPPPAVKDEEMLAAHEAGVADGYEAGLDDGSAGLPMAPSPASKYSDEALQATYVSAFNAGYSLGYSEGAEAKKKFTVSAASAETKGLNDGRIAGKADATNGGPYAPNPPYQSSWNSELNGIYASAYMNGYSLGYGEVKSGGGGVTGIHYATVPKQHHAGVRGLAQQNGGSFKNIVVTASVNGAHVEAAILGEPRHVASLGREAMPAVVMSAGPYHGHKLIITD